MTRSCTTPALRIRSDRDMPPRADGPIGRLIFQRMLAGIVFTVLPLAGCAQMDPYQRPGMWQPVGVNEMNIAAQIANPADLQHGRSDSSPHYRSATTPITDLWTAKKDPASGSPSAPPNGAPAASQGGVP